MGMKLKLKGNDFHLVVFDGFYLDDDDTLIMMHKVGFMVFEHAKDVGDGVEGFSHF